MNVSASVYPLYVIQKDPQPQAQPLVKWAGGKRQLQLRILEIFPDFSGTYFEPFLGGAAIFFALKPEQAVLSDINAGLINLYLNVKKNYIELHNACLKLESEFNNLDSDAKSEMFYRLRNAYNESERKGLDAAALFLFLNKAGFNGIYRENASGGFNVPFGKKNSINLASLENLEAASQALQSAELNLVGYSQSVSSAQTGDLVYFDPPYVPLSITSAFTSYTKEGFGLTQQEELANTFKELDSRGVKVALSNSKTDVIQDLYKGFNFHELSATRQISAKTSGRSGVIEYLVTNF
ncbi:MAG: Dam family site-specific DNA-(adenine-N6)-methyltransferase [Microbacteriaceae bacterium]|nr:Dam family site-specific DNA-(adenine-N6)-methyltransferase [Microbacteriaceae bacterium]